MRTLMAIVAALLLCMTCVPTRSAAQGAAAAPKMVVVMGEDGKPAALKGNPDGIAGSTYIAFTPDAKAQRALQKQYLWLNGTKLQTVLGDDAKPATFTRVHEFAIGKGLYLLTNAWNGGVRELWWLEGAKAAKVGTADGKALSGEELSMGAGGPCCAVKEADGTSIWRLDGAKASRLATIELNGRPLPYVTADRCFIEFRQGAKPNGTLLYALQGEKLVPLTVEGEAYWCHYANFLFSGNKVFVPTKTWDDNRLFLLEGTELKAVVGPDKEPMDADRQFVRVAGGGVCFRTGSDWKGEKESGAWFAGGTTAQPINLADGSQLRGIALEYKQFGKQVLVDAGIAGREGRFLWVYDGKSASPLLDASGVQVGGTRVWTVATDSYFIVCATAPKAFVGQAQWGRGNKVSGPLKDTAGKDVGYGAVSATQGPSGIYLIGLLDNGCNVHLLQ